MPNLGAYPQILHVTMNQTKSRFKAEEVPEKVYNFLLFKFLSRLLIIITVVILSATLLTKNIVKAIIQTHSYDPVVIIRQGCSDQNWKILDRLPSLQNLTASIKQFQRKRQTCIRWIVYFSFSNFVWFIHKVITRFSLSLRMQKQQIFWIYFLVLLGLKIVLFRVLIVMCKQMYQKFNVSRQRLVVIEDLISKQEKQAWPWKINNQLMGVNC